MVRIGWAVVVLLLPWSALAEEKEKDKPAMVGAQIRYGHLRGWDWLETWSVTPRAASIAVALLAVVLSPGLNPAFIYFQF